MATWLGNTTERCTSVQISVWLHLSRNRWIALTIWNAFVGGDIVHLFCNYLIYIGLCAQCPSIVTTVDWMWSIESRQTNTFGGRILQASKDDKYSCPKTRFCLPRSIKRCEITENIACKTEMRMLISMLINKLTSHRQMWNRQPMTKYTRKTLKNNLTVGHKQHQSRVNIYVKQFVIVSVAFIGLANSEPVDD